MMCPPKYYFLIKLHNLEEIRPSQILRLLKRYKATVAFVFMMSVRHGMLFFYLGITL